MLMQAGFTVKTLTTDNRKVNQNFIFEKLNKDIEIFAWYESVGPGARG